MPVLIVLRHAKAASPPGAADFDRPLADRGLRNATAAGHELRAIGCVPERVVCSPALRTRQTLDRLALDVPVEFADQVYGNNVQEIFGLLREQADEPASLLLVGHNPSMQLLALELTGTADRGFPTAAMAVIEWDGEWSDLWPGAGRLTAFWTPRG